MIKYILAALLSVTLLSAPVLAQTPAPQPKKEAAKKDTAKKTAPAKPKNDPKWKENSMAKKQAECKADPTLDKCKKKPAKDAKK